MLSVHDGDGFVRDARSAGVDAFVPKARLGTDLLPALAEQLDAVVPEALVLDELRQENRTEGPTKAMQIPTPT